MERMRQWNSAEQCCCCCGGGGDFYDILSIDNTHHLVCCFFGAIDRETTFHSQSFWLTVTGILPDQKSVFLYLCAYASNTNDGITANLYKLLALPSTFPPHYQSPSFSTSTGPIMLDACWHWTWLTAMIDREVGSQWTEAKEVYLLRYLIGVTVSAFLSSTDSLLSSLSTSSAFSFNLRMFTY